MFNLCPCNVLPEITDVICFTLNILNCLRIDDFINQVFIIPNIMKYFPMKDLRNLKFKSDIYFNTHTTSESVKSNDERDWWSRNKLAFTCHQFKSYKQDH